MENRNYSTEVIILGRKNFGEADRILTVFSKHYGKLRIIAKGIRRPTSRKKGSLEIFTHARLLLARGRNMDIVTDAEVKQSFTSWRMDLRKVGLAYHLVEIVDRMTAERQENKEIFDLLASSFEKLTSLGYWELYGFTQTFKMKVLEELGFLERGVPILKNIDFYIEDLINGKLKTRKFLTQIK